MRAALSDAGAEPEDVGYINAHGTSTPFNDRIETRAIHSIFDGGSPPVSSTKSAIGHLLGAAGAVEAIAVLGALQRGLLPPTLNFEDVDPDCDLDYVPDGPREAPGLDGRDVELVRLRRPERLPRVPEGLVTAPEASAVTPEAAAATAGDGRGRGRPRAARHPGARADRPAARRALVSPDAQRVRRRRHLRQRSRRRAPGLRLGAERQAQGRLARPGRRRDDRLARSRPPTRPARRSSASCTPAARACRRASARSAPTRRSSARRRARRCRRSASSAGRARAARRTRRRSARS